MITHIWKTLVMRLYYDVLTACMMHEGSITSSIRSMQHNRGVGGEDTSWHLDGLAIDVLIDSAAQGRLFQIALRKKGYRVLAIKNSSGRAFHVQYAWPIIKDFDRKGVYSHLKKILKEVCDDDSKNN